MRSRDLRALEFDKVLGLVTAQAVSEPGRRQVQALSPSTDPDEVRRRLTATSELVELRMHAGSLPIGEFKDQNPLFVVAAMDGATLDGKSLLDVRQFVLAARHLEAFLRSRCERYPAVARTGPLLARAQGAGRRAAQGAGRRRRPARRRQPRVEAVAHAPARRARRIGDAGWRGCSITPGCSFS